MNNARIGSNFDDFLKEEGLLEVCEAGALKRVIAWQLQQEMKRRKISLAKLADRMNMNIKSVEKLFATNDSTVTLFLLEKAAVALGRKLKIELT